MGDHRPPGGWREVTSVSPRRAVPSKGPARIHVAPNGDMRYGHCMQHLDGVSLGATRIDRWLTAARLYKTRGQAQTACTGGLVHVNGQAVKPSHLVKCGDEVRAEAPRGPVVLIVRQVAEKRLSATLARELYEDRSPPPPPPAERIGIAVRDRGAGRPTKADRRALDRLKGE